METNNNVATEASEDGKQADEEQTGEEELIRRELERLLIELEAVRAQRDKEESLKSNLESEIADLKVTLEDEADELYKSAQRRRHEAEIAHKLAIRRQQETLDAMAALVQQEKQLKKIAKSMGIKDLDGPVSPFIQFMTRLRKTGTAPATPAAASRAASAPLSAPVAMPTPETTLSSESNGAQAVSRTSSGPGSGPVRLRLGFQRHPSRQKLTELMRKRAQEAQHDAAARKVSSPSTTRKQAGTPTGGAKAESGWQSLLPSRAGNDTELVRQQHTTDLTTPPEPESGDEGIVNTPSDATLAAPAPDNCEPRLWDEFLEVYEARGSMGVDQLYQLPFLKRCVSSDVGPCLRSCGITDPAHWFGLMMSNQLVIEPDPSPGERMCGVTQRIGWCSHRYHVGALANDGTGWQALNEAATSRLVVVADLVAYTRHVAQGLITDPAAVVYAELVSKLLNMAAVRMGLSVLRPLHNA